MYQNLLLLPLFITTQCLNTSVNSLWPSTSLVLFTTPPGTKNSLPEMRHWLSLSTDDLLTIGIQPVISSCCPQGLRCKFPSMVLFQNNSKVVKSWPDPLKAYKKLGGEMLFHKVYEEIEHEEGILRGDFSQYQNHYISEYLSREKFIIGVFPVKGIDKNIKEFVEWRRNRQKTHPNEKMGYFYIPKGQGGEILKWIFDIKAGVAGDKMYYFINKSLGVKRGFNNLKEINGI